MKISRASPRLLRRDNKNLSWLERLLLRRSRIDGGSNRHMFQDDFLLIFTLIKSREGAPFSIDTNKPELADRLLANVAPRHHYRKRQRQITELVEEVANAFLTYGRAFFWMEHDEQNATTTLVNVSRDDIYSILGQAFQFCPPGSELDTSYRETATSREIRVIDRRRLLHLEMPPRLRRALTIQNRILSSLNRYDMSVPLAFQPKATHESPNPTTSFDYSRWREAQDLAFYRATRGTGWNGRMYDSEKRSDFFDCFRLIRFRRMQLTVRDEILGQLSKEFSRVGRNYDASFQVTISATAELQSIAQLDELEARLTREEVGFTEIIDFCLA
ncbi:hypothetical protein [Rhizobium leguminosarum]|uniref:hypothetical protein n=1 Tax=Rhizobium leguminosarum TaxID=384 RepID=UPI00143F19A4|nr:hypothetical protein [Rhizobium leguminosarum]MBY5761528.1 hypothetical protein [Rhizobium leguminosarum]NKL03387.1 hypothetical protein [Rhizobium leguminosarum bv. viciae]NKL82626.1 hypothetical protein [Rhizobium leguminosarum bv. viciae]NKL88552.1 hypothetical protein [Rhizobium leguminosarum bv. viciae]NKM93461.1 hypothetical protein [Rhizobium leguminosarum bv. viciae]